MSRKSTERNTSASATIVKGQSALDLGMRGRQRLVDFAQDKAGDVAILFGLMTMAMFMLIGAAVDIGRWLNARDQTIAAIDAAVLAAGRALQTNGGDENAAKDMAKLYYDQATKSRLVVKNDNVSFEVSDNGTAVEAKGNAEIDTPFMRLAGIRELPLLKNTGAEHSKVVYRNSRYGADGLNLEVAMMLDVSGSMGDGGKLQDMKDAATDLVDIVVATVQTPYTSKVSVVPFSGDVRPPEKAPAGLLGGLLNSLLNLVTPATNSTWPKDRTLSNKLYTKTACVGERMSTEKYSDVLPAVSKYMTPSYTRGGACSISDKGAVLPLTSDKTSLKAKINGLTAQGGTAGHVGTAWAYYMLSPKWTSLLPAASMPVAYNTPKTKKIAILMSDGEYNYTYDAKGFPTDASGSNGNSATSSAQALAICQQMKGNNIEVYTVGFDLGGNQTAINTLKNCATNASMAYTAEDGIQLRNVFRDIALKMVPLHLTK